MGHFEKSGGRERTGDTVAGEEIKTAAKEWYLQSVLECRGITTNSPVEFSFLTPTGRKVYKQSYK